MKGDAVDVSVNAMNCVAVGGDVSVGMTGCGMGEAGIMAVI